jgi:hypothetical protein
MSVRACIVVSSLTLPPSLGDRLGSYDYTDEGYNLERLNNAQGHSVKKVIVLKLHNTQWLR